MDDELESQYAGRDPSLAALYDCHGDEDSLRSQSWSPGDPTANDDRYEVKKMLGKGAMKTVHLAFDRATEREVALATLPHPFSDFQAAAFHAEARLTASLTHPHVIRVYDVGLFGDDTPFFTMQRLPARSLSDAIRACHEGDDRDLRGLLETLLRVCDGVAYAHESGVLHLDLKPDNVQVGRFGQVFVCDWGTAKAVSPEAAAIQAVAGPTIVRGTPAYMAPEQARGGSLDHRCDIYALGAILCTILTGKPPPSDVKGAVTAARRAHPIPAGLEAICLKAMAAEPADRYQTVLAFREDLDRYLSGHATKAEDPTLFTLAALLLARHKGIVTLALASLFILAAISVVFVRGLQASRRDALTALGMAVDERRRAEVAESRAFTERDAARAAQTRAEELLGKYTREKEITTALNLEIDDLRILAARSALAENRFDDALAGYESLIKDYPDDPSVWQELGAVHLVRQEFHAAVAAFERADEADDWSLTVAAKQFARIKADDAALLEPEDTVRLLRRIPHLRGGLRKSAFAFFVEREPSLQRRLPVVREMVMQASSVKQRPEFVLTERPEGNALRILPTDPPVGLNFVTYYSDSAAALPLLDCLHLVELDLSGGRYANIESFRYLTGLRILRLTDCPKVRLAPLRDLPKLRHLYLTADVYRPRDLDVLPESVQVHLEAPQPPPQGTPE